MPSTRSWTTERRHWEDDLGGRGHGRGGLLGGGNDHDVAHGGDLGQPIELGNRPRDPDHVARIDRDAERGVEHEDPFGSGRIGVGMTVFLLDVEAV